ncbi:MAG: hypothetical protein WCK34_11845 [Bacteroidota bacterium]
MKNFKTIILLCVFMATLSVQYASAQGPQDPAGRGNGILGFGFGPGIPYFGGDGFGPAILVHYDQSIWKAGPGSISLGGQIGTSFFTHDYYHRDYQYRDRWTNVGVAFRAAYHIGWHVRGLDTYAGFGAGTLFSMYHDAEYGTVNRHTSVYLIPELFVGASYYFTRRVGVNAELGYNFAVASVGLNFRLSK